MTKTPEEIEQEQEEQKRRDAEEAAKREKEMADAKEKAIKAEAQLEAFKEMMAKQAQQPQGQATTQLTEEQWKDFETQTGMTKQQLMAMDAIGKQHAEVAKKDFDAKAKAAEERAARAEEKLRQLESRRGEDDVKGKFYADKPALARYKAEVDDFLADYPSEMRSDPEKLKGLLNKAEVFIRGKLGDKVMNGNSTRGSARFGKAGEEAHTEEREEIDTENLPEQSRRLIERIRPEKEQEETFKKAYNGEGVTLRAKDEFAQAEKDMRGGR